MNIVIFAHQNWGVKGIQTILKTKHKIVHVFTHPEDIDENEKVWYQSVTEECQKQNIPVTEKKSVTNSDSKLIKEIATENQIYKPKEFFKKLWSGLE